MRIFHPEVPYLRKTLGHKFKDFGSDIDYLQSSYSSKFYQYEEGHYLEILATIEIFTLPITLLELIILS